MMKKIFKISGMHCASCSKLIEGELEDNGVSSKVYSPSGKATIEFNPERISEDKIKSLIKNLGYGVE
jgi:Cu+-exporting ATPase